MSVVHEHVEFPVAAVQLGDERVVELRQEACRILLVIHPDRRGGGRSVAPRARGRPRGLRRLVAARPGVRDQIVVAAVAYIENPLFFQNTLDELLWAAPHLGHLDVGIAGAVSAGNAGRLGQLPPMQQHGRLGIRAIGGSFHARDVARRSVTLGEVDVAFVRYNPLHPGARDDLFPALSRPRRALVFNFANSFGYVDTETWARLGLEDTLWRPQIHDLYRFALTRPELDGLLVAPRVPAHIERILRAVEEGPLTPGEEEHMIDLAFLAAGRATLGAPG